MSITFFVPGVPKPGGSKRGFPFRRKNGRLGVRMTDDSRYGPAWRRTVQAFAVAARVGPPLKGPLRLTMIFDMPRPRSHYGTGRNADTLKASAREYPTTKPDLTKILRSTEDALTGILWVDDAQVVATEVRKRYADPSGVSVIVATMTPDECILVRMRAEIARLRGELAEAREEIDGPLMIRQPGGVSVSPEIVHPRDKVRSSSLQAPSGAESTWAAMEGGDDA